MIKDFVECGQVELFMVSLGTFIMYSLVWSHVGANPAQTFCLVGFFAGA